MSCISHLKCSFKSISKKKFQNFALGAFLSCVLLCAIFPRNLQGSNKLKLHNQLCLAAYLNEIKVLKDKHFCRYFKENLGTLMQMWKWCYTRFHIKTFFIVHSWSFHFLCYFPWKYAIYPWKIACLLIRLIVLISIKYSDNLLNLYPTSKLC